MPSLAPSERVSASRLSGITTSDRWLSLLLDSTNTFPWESDLARKSLTFVGDRSEDVLGYSHEECETKDFWASHIFKDDADAVTSRSVKLGRTCNAFELEYRMFAADGRVIWVRDMVSVVRRKGERSLLRGLTMDVTQRKETETALRELGVQLMTRQEDERKRVARELHDDLSQRMAIFCIEIEGLTQQKYVAESADLSSALSSLNARAREMSAEIHRVAYDLHPAKLDDLGLKSALNSLCGEVGERHDIAINFRFEGLPIDIHSDVKLSLFRVTQEALNNVVRHSNTRTASVVLRTTPIEVRLTVSDSGCGFDTAKPMKGLGFVSMRERLRMLSGDLSIESTPKKGTVIQAKVPLRQAHHKH